jgi:opine dehydrogenase
MTDDAGMSVGIAGAGAIAYGTAALLDRMGHRPMLWSPGGTRTRALADGAVLMSHGAIEATLHPAVASGAQELAGCDVIVIALPGYGHKAVYDAIAPHLRPGQPVIVSSHASLGALYLHRLLAARGIAVPVIAWGTTVVTARQPDPVTVRVNTVRARVDLCTFSEGSGFDGLALCQRLFGDRFMEREGLLAISLSNLNPQNHLGIALGNITRMEKGEVWSQGEHVTPMVGRLLEALDLERLAIAEALGLRVRTIFEHFHLSFHVPVASISEMNQEMHRLGNGGTGPATADSRYVTEDVPYGLVPTVLLGDMVGRPAKLHRAGIDIFSAMYGRDFWSGNELINALDLGKMTMAQLQDTVRTGQVREP